MRNTIEEDWTILGSSTPLSTSSARLRNRRLGVNYRTVNASGKCNRDAAASAIQGLTERIVLIPGEKWAEMAAEFHGHLGTILEWAGTGWRASCGR